MDGTYNNPYAQAQSQINSPSTPTGGAYKANVNRKKTRKWVEAKVQSYDGDDWGADEFSEEDEPEPPPPVPRVTTGLRPVGQRLPSDTRGPSPRLAAAAAAGTSSQSSSGPPSLQIQTPGPASSIATEPTRDIPPAATNHTQVSFEDPVSRSSSTPITLQDPQAGLPKGPADTASASKPGADNDLSSNNAGPVDIFQRIEQEQRQAVIATLAPPEPAKTQDESDKPAPAGTAPTDGAPIAEPPTAAERTKSSASPQLPSFGRMSSFGTDFFATSKDQDSTTKNEAPVESASVPVPGALPVTTLNKEIDKPVLPKLTSPGLGGSDSPARPVVPILSAEDGSDTPSLTFEAEDASRTPKDQAHAPVTSAGAASVPPLRTPSPREPVPSTVDETSSSHVGVMDNRDITPTQPLQPYRLDTSLSNSQPPKSQGNPTILSISDSPAKDSDKLSEEILRTLSPGGASVSPAADKNTSLSPGGPGDQRQSSYTLSAYDNYWADSSDPAASVKPKEQEEPKILVSSTPAPATSIPQTTGHQQPEVVPSPVADSQLEPALRRRFSWEAPEPVIAAPATDLGGAPAGQTDAKDSDLPEVVESPPVQSPKDATSDTSSHGIQSPAQMQAPTIVVPPAGGITHQISNASSAQTGQPQFSMLEPPSPISVRTEESSQHAPAEDRQSSLSESKALGPTTSNSVSVTPPPDAVSTATVASPPGEWPNVSSLREIMNLPTPAQRINKLAESRQAFSTVELGLENWLASLKAQHPEYSNATASFSGAGLTGPGPLKGQGVSAATGPQASTQQPYYQQYLNASSPTTNAPPPGRSRLGSIPISSQSASSAFGNSGNQIGTKSKELMHSAGKMGKGLFSKGRSKLRGTGDKVFH